MESIFLDMIDQMPSDTWQSILATLAFMALICFIFMYNTFTVVVTTAVIASVCTGMYMWIFVIPDELSLFQGFLAYLAGTTSVSIRFSCPPYSSPSGSASTFPVT
jgi:hypothetical protein